MDDEKVYIMDVYNRQIYPHDGFAKSKYVFAVCSFHIKMGLRFACLQYFELKFI